MDEFAIAIVLWDGVEELDFAGPYEVLTAWSRQSDRPITVRTFGPSAEPVRCSHGLRVVPDATWDDLDGVDVFVLPGGDVRPLRADETFVDLVRKTAAAGTLMASVCTGALVYAQAGLLADRPATTHWSALDRLEALGAKVDRDARYVDDGNVVTSAGVSAGIDMSLHLVKRLHSEEAAKLVRRYIQYEPSS